ncbi:MAG: flagellar biosynthesis protein FlhB [Phenylobacterium zucineum]|nr:MAG: flagellar biosynthesis protein FlhB [Phenylobacterium zucineum]
MAEENDQESKTEEPTSSRLAQARASGDIVKTQDLPQLSSFAAVTAALLICGGWLSQNLILALMPFLQHPEAMRLQGGGGVVVARQAMMAAAPFLTVVLGSAAFAGVSGHLIQTGLIWSPDKLKLDFSKLNPMSGLQRLMGIDSLVNSFKSLVKVCLVGWIAYTVIKPHWPELQQLAEQDPTLMLPYVIDILKHLLFAIGSFMIAIAGFDWFWQRQRFMTRMRMTKEEVKEDFKQSEGDPHIKARQKAIRVQRARRRMMANVPKATVVVMNPTHFAVALKYEEGEGTAPQCVAKGVDAVALRIRAVAEAAGVTVIEDPPLARALFASVEVEDYIPLAHYEAVAKIIGFIMNGKKTRPGAVWP